LQRIFNVKQATGNEIDLYVLNEF